MRKFFSKIYFTKRFFFALGIIVAFFALSFFVDPLFFLSQLILLLLFSVLTIDAVLLLKKDFAVVARRSTKKVLSLGDDNIIELEVQNRCRINLFIQVIDELPSQLQERSFLMDVALNPNEVKSLNYTINPKQRGEYLFGKINLFSATKIGLLQRRDQLGEPALVKVYPSVVQMKKYELHTVASIAKYEGMKKIRRIGHSYEYEEIREYVTGDDTRAVNWKASGRIGHLMVNRYEDEKSQQVYCILDKSRSMRMSFDGMSLLDYAINTSLVISNVVSQKHDRIGLVSFSNKLGTLIKADSKRTQLGSIYQALYNEKENRNEADYELLHNVTKNFIRVRSLLFLFTNFENLNELQRVLLVLRSLNKQHLLVVVFFENTSFESLSQMEAISVDDVYRQTIAKKYLLEKELVNQELKKHKIQTIVSKPQDLSINTINKYLELKSRGLI